MRKQSRLWILALGLLAVGAAAQEIVIEPTNGHEQTTHRSARPVTLDTATMPAQPVVKSDAHAGTQLNAQPKTQSAAPAGSTRIAAKPAKKTSQIAEKPQTPPIEPKPSEPASSAAVKSEVPEAVAPAPRKIHAPPAWAMADTRDDHTLKSEIATALARDPKLTRSSIQIEITDAEVTLSGTANSTEERLQAERLAQSYAWNRKLVDHIEVVPSISAQK